MRPKMLEADAASLIEGLLASIIPNVDKEAVLGNKDMGQHLEDMFREGLKISSDGWVDDDLAFIEPWGFELSEVKVPVLIYHGSEDKMVPYAHGEWLAEHLPQEKVGKHLMQGEGHISIFLGQVDSIIDEILTVAKF